MKYNQLLTVSTVLFLALGSCKSSKSHLANTRSFGGAFGNSELIVPNLATTPDKENRQPLEQNKPANEKSNQSFSSPAHKKGYNILPGSRLFGNIESPSGDSSAIVQPIQRPIVEKHSRLAFILGIASWYLLFPCIPAIILGIIGLIEYKKNPELYKKSSITYAIIGIVLGVLTLALIIAIIVWLSNISFSLVW